MNTVRILPLFDLQRSISPNAQIAYARISKEMREAARRGAALTAPYGKDSVTVFRKVLNFNTVNDSWIQNKRLTRAEFYDVVAAAKVTIVCTNAFAKDIDYLKKSARWNNASVLSCLPACAPPLQ